MVGSGEFQLPCVPLECQYDGIVDDPLRIQSPHIHKLDPLDWPSYLVVRFRGSARVCGDRAYRY